jgi:predicted CopG family antitoxin
MFEKDGSHSSYDRSLDSAYFNLFRRELTPVFSKVIRNLKKRKEHLAAQLNFELGNLSEEEYNRQEEEYLDEYDIITEQELRQEIDVLYAFSDVSMDAEDVSVMFNCTIDIAEKALRL